MFVIESVLEAGLFHGDEICMITPYREQVTRIREAIIKAGANKNLRDRGILEVRVNTIDSMPLVKGPAGNFPQPQTKTFANPKRLCPRGETSAKHATRLRSI